MASLIEKIELPGFHLVQIKAQYRDIRIHIPTTNPVATVQKAFLWEVEFFQHGPDSRYNHGHFSMSSAQLPHLIGRFETAIEKMSLISSLERVPDIEMPIDPATNCGGFQPAMVVRAENSAIWLDFYVRFAVEIPQRDAELCLEGLRAIPFRAEALRPTLELLS